MKYLELVILFGAIISPQFFLANRLDVDELTKASAGAILGGTLVAGYKVWKGERDESPPHTGGQSS